MFKNFNRLDKAIVGVATLLLGISSYLTLDDAWLLRLISTDTSSLQQIGQVSLAKNDVRRRVKTAFSWLPLRQNEDIFQGDSIFTGVASEAEIHTNAGDQIHIAPNSLVVINSQEDSIQLDIDYGSIQGKVDKDKKLLIGSKEGVTEFSGDDALVKVGVGENNKLVVNVLEGQVEVKSQNETKVIDQNETIHLDDKEFTAPSQISIKLSEELNQRALDPDALSRSVLEWTPNATVDQFEIQFSEDPNFTEVIQQTRTDKTYTKIPKFEIGKKIHARVVGVREQGRPETVSNTIYFSVFEGKAADIVFPLDGQRLIFESDASEGSLGVDVIFTWANDSIQTEWEFQLSEDLSFSNPVESVIVRSNFIEVTNIREGTHFWRVRSTEWKNAAWSETATLTLIRVNPGRPMPAQLLVSEVSAEIDSLEISDSNSSPQVDKSTLPYLTWVPQSHRHKYLIQIAVDEKFKNIIEKQSVIHPFFIWKSAKVGTFYWRVFTSDARGQVSPPSRIGSLAVQLTPPRSETPSQVIEEVSDLVLLETAPPPFTISWSSTVLTAGYELELDTEANFPAPLRIQTSNTSKKIQTQTAGTYFWRVRSIDKNGRFLSEFSLPRIFEYKRVFKNPRKIKELTPLSPSEQETILFVGDGAHSIPFRWSRPFENATYYLQISQKQDFSDLAFHGKTEKSFLVLDKKLPKGWLHWRIRAESPHFRSPWTDSKKFLVKYEKSKFDPSQDEQFYKEQEEKAVQFLARRPPPKTVPLKSVIVNNPVQLLPQLSRPTQLRVADPVILSTDSVKARKYMPLTKASWTVHFSVATGYPNLEWRAVANADQYVIEIARDKKFLDKVATGRTNSNRWQWNQATPGTYYWRVSAMGVKHQESFSQQGPSFQVKVRPPNDAVLASRSFEIQWSPTAFARQYRLDLSKSESFEERKVFFIKTNSFKLLPKYYSYLYWRVQPLDKYGRSIGDFSKAFPLNNAKESAQRGLASSLSNSSQIVSRPLPESSWIHIGDRQASVEFRWNSSSENIQSLHIISSDESPISPISSPNLTSLNQWNIHLEKGAHTWEARNASGETVESGKFKVHHISSLNSTVPPLLQTFTENPGLTLAPPSSEKVRVNKVLSPLFLETKMNSKKDLDLTNKPIGDHLRHIKEWPSFTWSKTNENDRYLIEISEDNSFRSIVVRKFTKAPSYRWTRARPGNYFLRITPTSSPQSASDVQQITVEVSPPEPINSKKAGLTQTLQWSPVVYARSYEVQFSRSEDLKDFKVLTSDSNKIKVKVSEPGDYYWKVRPLDKYGRKIGEYSVVQKQQFTIAARDLANTDKPLTLLLPKNESSWITTSDQPANVEFSWHLGDTNRAGKIKVAKDALLKDIVLELPIKNALEKISRPLPEGRYFWAVESDSGEISSIQSFEVKAVGPIK